jgi:hypothetical protein
MRFALRELLTLLVCVPSHLLGLGVRRCGFCPGRLRRAFVHLLRSLTTGGRNVLAVLRHIRTSGCACEALPNGRGFRLRRVTWKSTPSNQGCLLLVWPLLRRGSFTPVSLRGPAPNGHPCPDGALAASMRLGPLHETSVQPAPKSRLVVPELFVYEDQRQIKAPNRSTASRLKPVAQGVRVAFSRTGFSGEEAGPVALNSALDRPHAPRGYASCDAPRHLKPVPLTARVAFSRTGFSREEASPVALDPVLSKS